MSNLVLGKYSWLEIIEAVIRGTSYTLRCCGYDVSDETDARGYSKITYYFSDEDDGTDFTVIGWLFPPEAADSV